MAGKQVEQIELDDAIFAAPVNKSLMHQALVRQLANARLGSHSTKTRGEVRGGGRKPWRQKGTGRARQGSTRSPNWVGGGTVFGPRPRKYVKQMPRKMSHAALRSALSVKAAAEQLVVIDALAMDAPRTKDLIGALGALDLSGKSVLMVSAEKNDAFQRSARNIGKVKTLTSGYLNVRDLLGYDVVVLSRDAVEHVHGWLGVDKAVAGPEAADAGEAEE
ncbi:MAG: 50S ribosomal protein L4 [Caldilineaceae bacterium]|nr:50S ribosomal protein L4 [Caldilineaceae bacterium]